MQWPGLRGHWSWVSLGNSSDEEGGGHSPPAAVRDVAPRAAQPLVVAHPVAPLGVAPLAPHAVPPLVAHHAAVPARAVEAANGAVVPPRDVAPPPAHSAASLGPVSQVCHI